ncbi:oxidoreductase [Pseudomonas sp. HUK17]|uniref:oxidoreductase n=1 Tax=Pseudomonas sp. HUK17 TaxID=1799359 RepID=UPI0009E91E5B|nr:hypothetical protein [Pseudomonas sp. HUK17]
MQNSEDTRKIFFLAINSGYAYEENPTDECIDFYRERSGNGLYCTIVGNVVIPSGTGTNAVSMRIGSSKQWQRLAESIRAEGAKPGIQLATTWPDYKGTTNFLGNKEESAILNYVKTGGAIERDTIQTTFERLFIGTEISIDAGFSHIQLHAAHGYLFNLMLDSRFCKHHEIAHELLNKWIARFRTKEIEISLRTSLFIGNERYDRTSEIELTLAQKLSKTDADYLDISSGFYNLSKRMIYPSTKVELEKRLSSSLAISNLNPERKFIISGKISPQSHTTLPKNISIGICRDLIANPKFLDNFSEGCSNCMKCHYYSRRKEKLTCGMWQYQS